MNPIFAVHLATLLCNARRLRCCAVVFGLAVVISYRAFAVVKLEQPVEESYYLEMLLKDAEVLFEEATEPDKNGIYTLTKVVVVTTDVFKYPNLLLTETIKISTNSEDIVMDWNMCLADHIIVGLKDGVTETELEGICQKYDAQIVRKIGGFRAYFVVFQMYGIETLDQKLVAFSAEDIVEYAERDSLCFADSIVPNDPKWEELWGMHQASDNDIDAPEAWEWEVHPEI